MKIRFLLVLVGLAISFALPSFAQEKNTVDPEVHQQIEALLAKADEAYNKHDAAALAAGYTEDAVFVGGGGGPEPHYVRQAIEKRIALDMASYPGSGRLIHAAAVVATLRLRKTGSRLFTLPSLPWSLPHPLAQFGNQAVGACVRAAPQDPWWPPRTVSMVRKEMD